MTVLAQKELIFNAFEGKLYTLGILIDLTKALAILATAY